ncbi:MAG TPA: ribosome assembly cofactor RimP [Bacteroidales bacterium]|nr:ribosome assembly cofactor RimP [Bacteroidales bacterium]
MISENDIIKIVNKKLEGTTKFLIEVKVIKDNKIFVYIDGDNDVTIDDCVMLSKHIEHQLNRDIEDFSLEVSSAGLTSPLKLLRQYKKYIGKLIEVITKEGKKLQGTLNDYSEKELKIQINKNKQQKENIILPFSEIKEVKPVIIF